MQGKIRIEKITKIYGRTPRQLPLKLLQEGKSKDEIFRRTKHVIGLSDVSFSIQEGEVFVVMGLSGSGKSTLIRCVNRLIEPTAGDIYIDDINVTELGKKDLRQLRRNRLAMVFQHFALFPHKTVAFNTGYGLRIRGESRHEWEERALKALEMVGLRDWADHFPHNLSGGMQQRVGLARALATNADILLMDEAFSALDPLIRREMQDELLNLQDQLHKTILFITHDLGEALRVGNRVAVMRDGYVVQIGTPQEIITEPADDYVAEFMSDVDSGRVLTAEFIMSPPHAVQLEKHTVADALARMDKHNLDQIYVVNKHMGVEGLLRRSKLELLREEKMTSFRKAIRGDFPRAASFTRLYELYQLSTQGDSIAILDERGRLEGVVYPLHIFEALASTSYENNNGNGADPPVNKRDNSHGTAEQPLTSPPVATTMIDSN